MTPLLSRVTHHDDRAAWLASRLRTVGASEVAAILRVSPWVSEYTAWARITGREPSGPESDAMRRGSSLEAHVLSEYGHALRHRGEPVDVLHMHLATIAHPSIPWARCSPDGITGPDTGVEAKTISESAGWTRDDWTEVRAYRDADGVMPAGYALQVYWTLAVTGARWWDLAVYGPTLDRLRVIRVHADPEAQTALLRRVGAWYDRHVTGDVAPDLDASDAARRAVSEAYARAAAERDPGERPATEAEREVALLYGAHRRIRDEADETCRTLATRLVQLADGARRVWWDGGSVSMVTRHGKVSPTVKIRD